MEGDKSEDAAIPRKRSLTSVDTEPGAESAKNTVDMLDSAVNEKKPVLSASISQKETELFEIIEKLQGSRLDEQRCEFPLPLKSQLLTGGGELPIVLPSKLGGYWIDPPLERSADVSPTSSHHGLHADGYEIMERDGEAKSYRQFFRSRYHHSFTAADPSLGPLVLSVCLEEEDNRMRVILRMKECSLHGVFSLSLFPGLPSAVELAKLTEEDILGNDEESEEFTDFLSILGDTVQLQGFTGFRGGLDVCHGQTGSQALVTSFHGKEIMFHVATKLPFTDGDPQQLQRKRHIGNDIVALVYQEGHTPFLADVIKSHFLHCFIVVRKVPREMEDTGQAAYRICITAREDVPPFGPVLPDPPIFTDRSLLREFLLTKLINAEISCYKAEQFSRLELRTRSSLLESLQAELSTRSQCMVGDPSPSSSAESVRGGSEGSGGFIENFKRAIRVRSHSFETLSVPRRISGLSPQKPKAEKDADSEKIPDGTGQVEVRDQASPQEET
ncbi:rap1 GTPase-activating protein 2 isoform X2 [Entelurus aequoreus]|uniref:rap1 GTPase-activating protein 2 isoform X2 n=1 Tax=Entelurus aequoreus TaxID=161455 RepID=UPI002B1D159A|nr:rap1 GTPase-activating protein 2 isoform X2 [Entelurus aequoreus]